MLRAVLTALALLAGAALTIFGLFLAWPPLAFVAAGVALVAFALTREVDA